MLRRQNKLPESFRPLLWYARWDEIDIDEDKDDIIMAALNEGTLEQWKWLIRAYGKEEIRRVLQHHLKTEFHPESASLAKLVFGLSEFRHARRGAN